MSKEGVTLIYASTIFAVLMGSFIIFMRMKASEKPVNAKKSFYHLFYEYGSVDVYFSSFSSDWS